MAAISSGSRALASWVSSTEKTTAVNGERITPAIAAAMPSRHQTAMEPSGSTGLRTPPTPAPINSSGARMPPLVPEPSATDQMTSFTITKPMRAETARRPASSSASVS